jgi:hypothetical protein
MLAWPCCSSDCGWRGPEVSMAWSVARLTAVGVALELSGGAAVALWCAASRRGLSMTSCLHAAAAAAVAPMLASCDCCGAEAALAA